jgi:surface polysaccharide O-acyltransferase-like enzyme
MVNSLKRVPGLDLVRSFAVFSVVSVHFLLNIGYYSYSMDGERMFILTAMRWFFYTCVPLFMIITGYLQHNKTIEKQYYKKMLRILYEYLAASILCNTFTTVYLHQEMSLGSWIKSILGFAAAPYSWYINI